MLQITEGQFPRGVFFSWSSHKTPVLAAWSLLLLKSIGVAPCSGRHIKAPFRWRFSLLRCVFHLLSSCPFSGNHSLNHEYTIGPFQERQTNASFSNSLLNALLPSFPKMTLDSFGDLLEAHFAFIIHPTLQLFSTLFPPTFFFSLLTHARLSSPTASAVWHCKHCLGSRLLSV